MQAARQASDVVRMRTPHPYSSVENIGFYYKDISHTWWLLSAAPLFVVSLFTHFTIVIIL
jgi:hypothetical protein